MIIASSLRICFLRRNQKGLHTPRLEAAWETLVWGTPLALTTTLLFAALGLGLVALRWLALSAITIVSALNANSIAVNMLLRLFTAMTLLVSISAHGVINLKSVFAPAAHPVLLALVMIVAALLIPLIRTRAEISKSDQRQTESI